MSIVEGLPILEELRQEIEESALLAPLWPQKGDIAFYDQTRLPFERQIRIAAVADHLADAIRSMQIRGSGAIGCAGAFGAYLAVRAAPYEPEGWDERCSQLAEARPTAIILQTAVNEVLDAAREASPDRALETAAAHAVAFFRRQLDMERRIGQHGAEIIPDGATVLTHCHSGALAGAGYGGRALSVIRAAMEAGKKIEVIAQETRPYLQGARITAWELSELGIPVRLATDGMSGALMEKGLVDVCVVGSDRLAANGDLVNKTGTYLVALAAREHQVPFYTATTRYNIDLTCPDGTHIPIEMRPESEVLNFNGQPTSVPAVRGIYPAFDITPAHLLAGIITEAGVLRRPFAAHLASLVQGVDL
jgi:methylthioribose-1-phosphate isomerase